jgi:hypothetical protein
LYGSFGLQALLSILVDAGGAFNNIQYRLYPTFALLGVAIIAETLGGKFFRRSRGRLAKLTLGGAIVAVAALSMLKATNEASLVNNWTFYTRPEIQAVQWLDQKIENSVAWTGFSNRLSNALLLSQGESAFNNSFTYIYDPAQPYIFISDWIHQQGARIRASLPDIGGFLVIYDNGTAQIYHLRPVTPYQH